MPDRKVFKRPSRDPNFPRTDTEFKRMVFLTAETTFDLARGGNPVSREDIQAASKTAHRVVVKERERGQ